MRANPWLDLVHAYLRSRTGRRALADTSRESYRAVLTDFAAGMASVGTGEQADLIAKCVDGWLSEHAWATTTVCTNLGIVRPFLDWAAVQNQVTPGVSKLLTNPRKPPPLPRALTARHVAALLAVVPDARGRCIVLLEGQCGLRRAEVAAIQTRDLDLADGSLIVHGKGGTERRVYLSPETMRALREWLIERGPRAGYLICPYGNRVGQRLTPTWIGMLVARWMKEAGLKTGPGDGVSGHALRHTAATQLLRDGANIRVVQAALGHSAITTTARYLRADDPEVRAAMSGLSYNRNAG